MSDRSGKYWLGVHHAGLEFAAWFATSDWDDPKAAWDDYYGQVLKPSEQPGPKPIAKQKYVLADIYDEDGHIGYVWKWLVPATHTREAYYEVAVCDAEDFWAGRPAFGYSMEAL